MNQRQHLFLVLHHPVSDEVILVDGVQRQRFNQQTFVACLFNDFGLAELSAELLFAIAVLTRYSKHCLPGWRVLCEIAQHQTTWSSMLSSSSGRKML